MSFKTFDLSHDIASIISAVNEVITVSSSLFDPNVGSQNVKTYANISNPVGATTSLGGYWQTVFDSSPTSIQSTALFDVTFGYSTASVHYSQSIPYPLASANEKVKIYQEMASLLQGSPISKFNIANSDVNECFFILIKRGIMKDELKKGVVSLVLNHTDVSVAPGRYNFVTASDAGAASAYKQTVGGDYAPMYREGATTGSANEVGQVWYNAGIIVIPALSTYLPWNSGTTVPTGAWSGSSVFGIPLTGVMTSSRIDDIITGFRQRVDKVNFQNQTNLYSTVYFCRATNTEFNYSSNPTYLDPNQRIRVTSGSNVLQSRTYITKVGLYDANDNLLAVGSVNKPITKSPDTESIFRIRLDY